MTHPHRYGKIQELHNEKLYQSSVNDIRMLRSADEWKRGDWLLENSKLDITTAHIFEIGSGPGTFFDFLKEHGAKNYHCCDANVNAIATFKRCFPDDAHRIAERDALTAIQELPSNTYDCFVASMILEHFEEDYLMEVWHAMVEKLKPGGELWIHVPCAESILSIYPRYYDMTHKRSFVTNNFSALAEMSGLKLTAKTGKLIAVNDLKTGVKYAHDKIIYWVNRLLFAFIIGTRKEHGVFSTELTVILKR